MTKKKKVLAGLSNIHFAPLVDGTYQTPVPILFAKKIENKLEYENDQEWADDKVVENGYDLVGGEGTLTVLALTSEEQALLFGNTIVKGGIKVNSADVSPQGAFLFERKKKRSTHKRLYVIYNCFFLEKSKDFLSFDYFYFSCYLFCYFIICSRVGYFNLLVSFKSIYFIF